MSRDPVLKATDIALMYEQEERATRWTKLYYAAIAFLKDGTPATRQALVRATDALEERR